MVQNNGSTILNENQWWDYKMARGVLGAFVGVSHGGLKAFVERLMDF